MHSLPGKSRLGFIPNGIGCQFTLQPIVCVMGDITDTAPVHDWRLFLFIKKAVELRII